MPDLVNRRQFLVSAGMVIASTAVPACQPNHPVPTSPDAAPDPEKPNARIRRDLTKAEGRQDLADYDRAVKLLKQMPADDPLNWGNLAKIHKDHCPHGNWWFLPWHRAYVQHFEQACRKVLGKETFSLPYWNWSKDRAIPAAFWEGDLAHRARDLRRQQKLKDDVDQSRIDELLNTPDFVIFGSRESQIFSRNVGSGTFESIHNYVHRTIGGDMGDMMSPLDPIFWVHHANIDRIWAEWQDHNAKYEPRNQAWLDQKLPTRDRNGRPVEPATKDVLSTYELGYKYDTQGPPRVFGALPGAGSFSVAAGMVAKAIATKGQEALVAAKPTVAGATVTQIPKELQEAIDRQAGPNPPDDVSLRLVVEDMKVDPKVSFGVRVYLNSDDPLAAKGIKDPHYVGDVHFFALGHTGHDHNDEVKEKSGLATVTAFLPLNPVVRRLGESLRGKPLNVQCVPILVTENQKPTGLVEFRSFRIEASSVKSQP